MKINELSEKIIESKSIQELLGLRVCRVILDDIDSHGELCRLINERIHELEGSEV